MLAHSRSPLTRAREIAFNLFRDSRRNREGGTIKKLHCKTTPLLRLAAVGERSTRAWASGRVSNTSWTRSLEHFRRNTSAGDKKRNFLKSLHVCGGEALAYIGSWHLLCLLLLCHCCLCAVYTSEKATPKPRGPWNFGACETVVFSLSRRNCKTNNKVAEEVGKERKPSFSYIGRGKKSVKWAQVP